MALNSKKKELLKLWHQARRRQKGDGRYANDDDDFQSVTENVNKHVMSDTNTEVNLENEQYAFWYFNNHDSSGSDSDFNSEYVTNFCSDIDIIDDYDNNHSSGPLIVKKEKLTDNGTCSRPSLHKSGVDDGSDAVQVGNRFNAVADEGSRADKCAGLSSGGSITSNDDNNIENPFYQSAFYDRMKTEQQNIKNRLLLQLTMFIFFNILNIISCVLYSESLKHKCHKDLISLGKYTLSTMLVVVIGYFIPGCILSYGLKIASDNGKLYKKEYLNCKPTNNDSRSFDFKIKRSKVVSKKNNKQSKINAANISHAVNGNVIMNVMRYGNDILRQRHLTESINKLLEHVMNYENQHHHHNHHHHHHHHHHQTKSKVSPFCDNLNDELVQNLISAVEDCKKSLGVNGTNLVASVKPYHNLKEIDLMTIGVVKCCNYDILQMKENKFNAASHGTEKHIKLGANVLIFGLYTVPIITIIFWTVTAFHFIDKMHLLSNVCKYIFIGYVLIMLLTAIHSLFITIKLAIIAYVQQSQNYKNTLLQNRNAVFHSPL